MRKIIVNFTIARDDTSKQRLLSGLQLNRIYIMANLPKLFISYLNYLVKAILIIFQETRDE